MPAMVLEFRSKGIQQLSAAMRRATQEAKQLAAAQAGTGGGVSGGGGMGGSPLAAQIRAQRQAAASINARLGLQRAQARLAKSNAAPPSMMDRLGQVALSTRFNIGGQSGGVSPLVGQTMKALGIAGKAAGPIALLAAAAVAAGVAVKAFAVAVNEGGAASKALRDAATASGGSVGDAAKLRAFGVSPDAAKSLRDRLATDPMAKLAAAQLGMPNTTPRQYGEQNDAKFTFRLLDALKKVTNPEERRRKAAMIGPEAEALLPLVDMSDKARASLEGTAAAFGKIVASQPASAAADLDAAWKRVGIGFDALKVALFNAFGGELTTLVNGLADALMGMAEWVNTNRDLVRQIAAGAVSFIGVLGAIAALIEQVTGKKVVTPAANPHTTALNNNTAAMNKNTTALQQAQTYGGGSRAAGALPSHLNGQMLNNAARNAALRLSPW